MAEGASLLQSVTSWRLTKHLSAHDFSSRVVPVSPTVWTMFLAGVLCMILHELKSASRSTPKATTAVQMVFFNFWFLPHFYTSIIAPVSLDFCLSLGQNATMSGLFLGCPVVGATLGAISGRVLLKEGSCSQAFARKVVLLAPILGFLALVPVTALAERSVSHEGGAKTFWSIVLLIQVFSAATAFPVVPLFVMQTRLTPSGERSFWMTISQTGKIVGMLIGPGVFSLISFALKQKGDISPGSSMAWMFVAIMAIGMLLMLYACMTLPSELPELEPEVQAVEDFSLEPAQRESVVTHMVLFSFERPFSIAGIEVATIMLLEVSYRWSLELCGTAFTVIAATSLLCLLTSAWLLSTKVLSEATLFLGSSLLSLFGVCLLFDFGTGPFGLLLADALVYGMAVVSAGLADSWASKAAMANSSFSIEAYRLKTMIAMNATRFASPILARMCIDFGGRNAYASLQFLFVLLGEDLLGREGQAVSALRKVAIQTSTPSVTWHLITRVCGIPEPKALSDRLYLPLWRFRGCCQFCEVVICSSCPFLREGKSLLGSAATWLLGHRTASIGAVGALSGMEDRCLRCVEGSQAEFQEDTGAFVLLQLENTRVVKVATASLHDYWWTPMAYVLLLTAAFMLLHGCVFRPHKSIFLLLAPLSIAALPLYGHAEVAEIPVGEVGFFVAKMILVITPVQLCAALCVADAEHAWPLPAFVHQACVYCLKGRQWPFLVFYVILLLNILDAVISDMAKQYYLNAVTGFCLMLTVPFPGPRLQSPLGESDMAAIQTELQGQEATDEKLRAHAAEWYVARTNVNGRQMSDVCANLDFLWVKLYTSWNLLFMLGIAPEHLNENQWAILLVPLLENARIRYVIGSQGIKLTPWTSSHWLQVRAFSLWLYLLIRLTPQFQALVEKNPKSFFQVANTEQNRQSWGIFNMVWALLYLCWVVLRPYLTKK